MIINLDLHYFDNEVKSYIFECWEDLDDFMENLTQEDFKHIKGYTIFENGELVEACFRPNRKEKEK